MPSDYEAFETLAARAAPRRAGRGIAGTGTELLVEGRLPAASLAWAALTPGPADRPRGGYGLGVQARGALPAGGPL